MTDFKVICKMTQVELKKYMESYLKINKYNVINEDGFLYAKGDIPVLLVAHMDTVHKKQCKEIIEKDGVLSSPQGIGGDDRCGIYMIAKIIKELRCSVLFCEDEEIGCVGASKFCKTEYIKNLGVNYMIELDRKGNNDAVFYKCDNPDFTEFIIGESNLKKETGSFSDISKLAPAAGVAAVNISCGYFNAHTTGEYVVFSEMESLIDVVKDIIKCECPEPFKYIPKKTEYPTMKQFSFNDFGVGYQRPKGYDPHVYPGKANRIDLDLELELEVVVIRDDGNEDVYYATGKTKAECWADLFLSNTDICYDMITDYTFV